MTSRHAYHHGNLKEAALQTAYQLQANRDQGIVGLREVARTLGVNHAALNRHFGDKAGFLAAVAGYCYQDLTKTLQLAVSTDKSASVQLVRLAVSFQRYAYENPGFIELFLEPSIVAGKDEALLREYEASLGVLHATLASGQAKGEFTNDETKDLAYLVWTFCLGYWENNHAKRKFDGSVPTSENSWQAVERHFNKLFGILMRGFLRVESRASTTA